jgi:hypothetical protein
MKLVFAAAALAMVSSGAMASDAANGRPSGHAGSNQSFRVAQGSCTPGASRCGADGYVERCDSDGRSYRQTMQKCR